MRTVEIYGKVFQLLISQEDISESVRRIANQMNRDLAGKNPLFIGLLNGAFIFLADLIRYLDFECNVSFVKLKSYEGLQSSGKVTQTLGLTESVEGRTVVIVEDIIDSGITLTHFLNELKQLKPAEIKIASMFYKPDACIYKIDIDYLGKEIPNQFVIGYGLDFNGLGRNYGDLFALST